VEIKAPGFSPRAGNGENREVLPNRRSPFPSGSGEKNQVSARERQVFRRFPRLYDDWFLIQ